jgi:hypothetical protein
MFATMERLYAHPVYQPMTEGWRKNYHKRKATKFLEASNEVCFKNLPAHVRHSTVSGLSTELRINHKANPH